MDNVRVAVLNDVDVLIPIIPAEDNVDLIRGWGMPADVILRFVFPASDECFSILFNGRVVGLFGVMSSGNIWLMRGIGIDNVALRFVRHGHEFVDRWLVKYGRLFGYISKDYKKFIRWLAWEGFHMIDLNNGYLEISKSWDGRPAGRDGKDGRPTGRDGKDGRPTGMAGI